MNENTNKALCSCNPCHANACKCSGSSPRDAERLAAELKLVRRHGRL